ncbi:MAG: hypothetical protein LBK67_09895 [Coriobacteriales bacterium]|jgi:hypothetical protein|nr:hypothetical protein [Coriobacteriales bacterium]
MMGKVVILHDLERDEAERLLPKDSTRYSLFAAKPPVQHCVGCFRCWVKTPGTCVIDDRGAGFVALMATHDEVIFLSRLVFGGLSPDVKAVLDRSIGFALPFFRRLNAETHHAMRFDKSPDLHYLLYGSGITEQEKKTAQRLATANALNLGVGHCSVSFFPSAQEGAEALRDGVSALRDGVPATADDAPATPGITPATSDDAPMATSATPATTAGAPAATSTTPVATGVTSTQADAEVPA